MTDVNVHRCDREPRRTVRSPTCRTSTRIITPVAVRRIVQVAATPIDPFRSISATRSFSLDVRSGPGPRPVACRGDGRCRARVQPFVLPIFALRPPSSPAITGRALPGRSTGGTHVIVSKGDVGTNANMTYCGSGKPTLHWTADTRWTTSIRSTARSGGPRPDPKATKIGNVVPDPAYPVPQKGLTPPVGAVDTTGCAAIAAASVRESARLRAIPFRLRPEPPDMTKITCYQTGRIQRRDVTVNNGTLAHPGARALLLRWRIERPRQRDRWIHAGEPRGRPRLPRIPGSTEFKTDRRRIRCPTDRCPQCWYKVWQSRIGVEATAALDYSGASDRQTNGTTPQTLMTLIVPPDQSVSGRVSVSHRRARTSAENKNKSIDLSGGTGLYLAGVQYAPTDNITIAGNSSTRWVCRPGLGMDASSTPAVSIINQEGALNQPSRHDPT